MQIEERIEKLGQAFLREVDTASPDLFTVPQYFAQSSIRCLRGLPRTCVDVLGQALAESESCSALAKIMTQKENF